MSVTAFFQSFEACDYYFESFTQNLIDFRCFKKISMWTFKNMIILSYVFLILFKSSRDIKAGPIYEDSPIKRTVLLIINITPTPCGKFDNF